MAVTCCLRFLLTLLHALIGFGAGVFCLYSLIGWSYDTTCLPKLVDQFGNQLQFKNGLLVVCDSIVYGMAVVCLLNFGMCLIVNWLWENSCVAFINLLLTIIYVAFAVMGGTTIALYYLVWCDSLERKFTGSVGCAEAVQRYDSVNATGQMSMYKTRLEVQMASIWALFPPIGFIIVIYALTLRVFAKLDARDGRLRYIILHDETVPLLHNDNSCVNSNESAYPARMQNLPNVTPGSSNPFDN